MMFLVSWRAGCRTGFPQIGNYHIKSLPSRPALKISEVQSTMRIKITPSSRTAECSLCRHTEFSQVADRDRKSNELKTVVCKKCGLVSHECIPSNQELLEYYQEDYRSEYNGEATPSAYRVLREWDRGQALVKQLGSYLAESSDVLEVGSGIGCTVKSFELAGYRSIGIEPGRGFCEYSRNVLDADVSEAILADLPAEERYDMVMLVHVLEHLNDPMSSFEHVHSLLRPGGLFYVEVPNCGAPHAAPPKMFHYAHIFNYASWTLSHLGQSTGFDVKEVISSESNKNLQILFQKSNTRNDSRSFDMNGYEKSCASLTRYTNLTYHLRWNYVTTRMATMVHHLCGRIRAERRLEKLIKSFPEKSDIDSGIRRAA